METAGFNSGSTSRTVLSICPETGLTGWGKKIEGTGQLTLCPVPPRLGTPCGIGFIVSVPGGKRLHEERVITLLDRLEKRLTSVLEEFGRYSNGALASLRKEVQEHEERIDQLENELAALLRREGRNRG